MGNYFACNEGSWNPVCYMISTSQQFLKNSSYEVTGSDGKPYTVKVWPTHDRIDSEDVCFLDDTDIPDTASPSLRRLVDLQNLDKLFDGSGIDTDALTELYW